MTMMQIVACSTPGNKFVRSGTNSRFPNRFETVLGYMASDHFQAAGNCGSTKALIEHVSFFSMKVLEQKREE